MRLPLFVLVGDPFLCEEKRKTLLQALEKKFNATLPLVLRRAGEFPLDSLLLEARTLPFLAPAQVFCLRDAQEFKKGEWDLWETYFQSPPPRTFFIFEAESLERNHPLLEWARKGEGVFFLEREKERLVSHFIRTKLQQAGKKMTPEAFELLESLVGDSFSFLDSLIDQLILSVGERREIDASVVEAFEERLFHFEGRDLLEALGGRNLAKALERVEDLLELSGRDVSSLMGLLHWQLRRFWQAKQWLEEGLSEGEITNRLRLFPARAELFFKELRRFSREELEEMLEGLFHLDWELKTGRAEGRFEIEEWLIRSASD